jgi:hypothetical protein
LWCVGGHLHRKYLKRKIHNLRRAAATAPKKKENHIHNHTEAAAMQKELESSKAKRAPKGSSGKMFFSKFTSIE